jgi:hypothetical protein
MSVNNGILLVGSINSFRIHVPNSDFSPHREISRIVSREVSRVVSREVSRVASREISRVVSREISRVVSREVE